MQTKRTFDGLLNADDAAEAIQPNEYINSENFRFGGHLAGQSLRMEVIESNREIANTLLSEDHDSHVIGRYVETVRDRIFYFVIDDNGGEAIYCFNQSDETIQLVLRGNQVSGGFGFSKDRYIHSIDMVDNLLYWVDYPNPQRRINVEAALKANNPSYVTDVDAYNISAPIAYTATTVIRKPPNRVLDVVRVTDSNINVNQIKDHGFRFSYRYVYRDGETSTLAPHSILVPANIAGETFNAIDVKIPTTEKIEQDVLVVELAVIYASDNTFFVVKRWDKRNNDDLSAINGHNSGSSLTFRFSNNSLGAAISQQEKVKPFDSVPVTSHAQAIGRNRIFYGNNVVGYDTPKCNTLALTVLSNTASGNTSAGMGVLDEMSFTVSRNGVAGIQVPATGTFQYVFFANAFVSGGVTYSPGYYVNLNPFTQPFPLTIDPAFLAYSNTSDIQQFCAFLIELDDTAPAADGWNPVVDGNATIFYLQYNHNIQATGTTGGANISSVLKSDASYRAGIVFYDQWMRQCGVVESPTAFTTTPDRTYDDFTSFNYGIGWTLTNDGTGVTDRQIPEWAHYYSIVVSRCLRTDFFFQSRTDTLRYATLDADGALQVDNATTAYSAKHAGIAVRADLLFGYGLGYTYEQGDVLKIYVDGGSDYEVPVKAVIGDWIIGELVSAGDLAGDVALYEVYRPKVNAEGTYYEIGQVCPISSPGTDSRAYTATNGSLPPDTWLLTRSDGTDNYLVEAMNRNDKIWRQWHTSHGRIQVVDPVGQQIIETGVSFSNPFLPGTSINGISSFEALNNEVLPLEMGPIRKMVLTNKAQAEGTVMLAIGEDETASLYLGESQLFNASGVSSVVISDKIIGQVNVLRGGKGTRHPESVATEDGYVFWFDVVRGEVISYSQAGLFAISDYKMKRFWRKFSDQYINLDSSWWTSTGQRNIVVGAVDKWNGEHLISIPRVLSMGQAGSGWDIFDGQAETVSYRISSDKWVGAYSYTPEGMAVLNNVLYSFKLGNIWCHDVKTNEVSFYEQQYNARLMVAENAGSFDATKTWQTISVIGNREPDYVEAESFLPYAQLTNLDGADFRKREGKFYADWRRNINTGGMSPSVAILRGERMRGQVLFVRLEYTGDANEGERIYINSLHLGVILSTGHTI